MTDVLTDWSLQHSTHNELLLRPLLRSFIQLFTPAMKKSVVREHGAGKEDLEVLTRIILVGWQNFSGVRVQGSN